MSLSSLRSGLATALATTGAKCDPWPKKARNPPELVIVDLRVVDYDNTSNGALQQLEATVRLFVSSTDIESAQRKIDPYVAATGSNSVRAAIKADRRLGGAAQDARVVSTEGARTTTADGVDFAVCDFTLAVMASI